MESLRKKYKRGEIDQKTYREKVTELTILHLESIDYKYIGKIADGTHGVVVELKSPNSALKVAVKIVIDELVTDGEIITWPKLVNEHILPLVKWQDIVETNTKAFFTQKHPETLQDKLKQSSFLSKSNGFENAVTCIKDITNGIHYLHKEGLCHLNLQTDHVLLKANNRARIGSFGYLISKDAKELKYGSSAIFRPPEAYQTNEKIDGQKFDIWSLGILATEIFTGQYLSKQVSKRIMEPTNWYFELYEEIFDVLEKNKFKELMKNTFKNSVDIDSNIDQVRNFITSCLILNSEDRPSADNLLKHQLIGGEMEKCCLQQYDDIWAEKTNPINLLMLKLEYGNQSFSENYAFSSEDETERVNDVKLNESGGEEVENDKVCNSFDETMNIQNDVKVEKCSTINSIKDTIVVKYDDDLATKIDSTTLYAAGDGKKTITNGFKKCEPKENLDTAEINREKTMKHVDVTNLNDASKDIRESLCEEIHNLQKNDTNENFHNPDIFNDNEMNTDEPQAEIYPYDYINASKNDEYFDKEKSDYVKNDDDPSLYEKIDDVTKKEDNINTNVLDIENEMHIDHNNIEHEESSLKQSNSIVYDSTASSLKPLHSTDKSSRKKRRKKLSSENDDKIKNSPTHTTKWLYEQSDQVNDNEENTFKRNDYRQDITEIIETSSSSSSVYFIPKRYTLEQNTQQIRREVPLYSKKLVKLNTKHLYRNEEQLSSDISLRQTSKKKKKHRHKIEKVNPSTSSFQTVKIDDDDEIEPGEIPLFRKNNKNILDHVGQDYSVTSLSVFDASYDEDLEEGEVDLNNQDSRQNKKRFKKIRSWWKRQKQNISSIFKACIP